MLGKTAEYRHEYSSRVTEFRDGSKIYKHDFRHYKTFHKIY